MQDKLLIISKIKKTISYIDNVLVNFPKTEYILKNNISSNFYDTFFHKKIIFMNISFINEF